MDFRAFLLTVLIVLMSSSQGESDVNMYPQVSNAYQSPPQGYQQVSPMYGTPEKPEVSPMYGPPKKPAHVPPKFDFWIVMAILKLMLLYILYILYEITYVGVYTQNAHSRDVESSPINELNLQIDQLTQQIVHRLFDGNFELSKIFPSLG